MTNNNIVAKKGGIFIKNLKRILLSISLLFVIIFIPSASLAAKEKEIYVIPGGESIGLQISTGIYVTGKYHVDTGKGEVTPWKNGDIEIGDKILEVNGKAVNSIEDIQNILVEMTNNQDVILKVKRKNDIIITRCEAVKAKNGKMTLGLYVKDEVLGVGTLTFINPSSKTFGALGHSVISEELNDPNLGYISTSSINGIRKSLPGVPGEKQATLSGVSIGTIKKNSNIGIYGSINNVNDFTKEKKMRVANPREVKLGKAEIWTVLDNEVKGKYEVEIIDVKNQTSTGIKGIKIQITDKDLLDKTGGIVQGMSGSPIVQNGLLVGAVSHVVVDTPDYGYGVYAMWMVNNF